MRPLAIKPITFSFSSTHTHTNTEWDRDRDWYREEEEEEEREREREREWERDTLDTLFYLFFRQILSYISRCISGFKQQMFQSPEPLVSSNANQKQKLTELKLAKKKLKKVLETSEMNIFLASRQETHKVWHAKKNSNDCLADTLFSLSQNLG